MLERIRFEIIIHAPVRKVWDTMLMPDTYRKWTELFDLNTTYEGTWEKGTKMKFIGSGGEGMYSEIKEMIQGKFISIHHLGILKNGEVDTESEEAKKWSPAYENYTFNEFHEHTKLEVDVDVFPEHKEMFERVWPLALERLKSLCE